ncbi:hypothetical protein KAR91_16265 [Candidatus Pacearchaeota archaeon]|nr:hypothetical protein [Candidatus Pacearchaeota archaeon]
MTYTERILQHLFDDKCKTQSKFYEFLKENKETFESYPDDKLKEMLKWKAPEGWLEGITGPELKKATLTQNAKELFNSE